MPGEAPATGSKTWFELAPPDLTIASAANAGAFGGTTAVMEVGVIAIGAAVIPPIESVASLPNPSPCTTTVSPGEIGPSVWLAILSTASMRKAGGGASARLLTHTFI